MFADPGTTVDCNGDSPPCQGADGRLVHSHRLRGSFAGLISSHRLGRAGARLTGTAEPAAKPVIDLAPQTSLHNRCLHDGRRDRTTRGSSSTTRRTRAVKEGIQRRRTARRRLQTAIAQIWRAERSIRGPIPEPMRAVTQPRETTVARIGGQETATIDDRPETRPAAVSGAGLEQGTMDEVREKAWPAQPTGLPRRAAGHDGRGLRDNHFWLLGIVFLGCLASFFGRASRRSENQGCQSQSATQRLVLHNHPLPAFVLGPVERIGRTFRSIRLLPTVSHSQDSAFSKEFARTGTEKASLKSRIAPKTDKLSLTGCLHGHRLSFPTQRPWDANAGVAFGPSRETLGRFMGLP
jgi:hypothetical protein